MQYVSMERQNNFNDHIVENEVVNFITGAAAVVATFALFCWVAIPW